MASDMGGIKALETKAAQGGLTIEERAALERREANDEIDKAVNGIATEFPEYGQKRVAVELKKKRGIKISLTCVHKERVVLVALLLL